MATNMKKGEPGKEYRFFSVEITVLLICTALLLLFFFVANALWGRPVLFGGICGVLYIASVVALAVFGKIASARNTDSEDIRPALGNIMLEVVSRLHMPAILCDEKGKIIWHNNSFYNAVGRGDTLYGMPVSAFTEVPAQKFINCPDGGDSLLHIGERSYLSHSYKVKTSVKNYRLVLLTDTTESERLTRLYESERTVLAYIIIDNVEELQQYVSEETYGPALAEVRDILKKWAEELDGVLREYERNKYLLVFEDAALLECLERRFDILDRIRDVRLSSSGSSSVTASIGVARVEGSLPDRERASAQALDMALERGGDQAVYKSAEGVEFYGGRTQTSQKRTKVRARVVANQLVNLITHSDNVLIMGHRFADFDCIGASVGIYRLARFCGVRANIIINPADNSAGLCMARLNMLNDYKDAFTDADAALEMIGSETLLVVVDVNNPDLFEAPDVVKNVFRTAYVDHHRKAGEFDREPEISYIEPAASSSSELVSEILELCLPAKNLLREEAELLLAGILLDTKQFTRNTGTRTFSSALYLRREGANPSDAQALFRMNFDDYQRESRFQSNLAVYRGNIAIALSEAEGEAADKVAAARVANKLLEIEGIAASFALVRINSTVHISARSSGTINVQLILEKLKGGGHFDVAGAQIDAVTVKDALVMLKNAIDEYFDNVAYSGLNTK